MNIKEIIHELEKLGFEVKYRKRTDGGYLIQQINNMTFTGSKGNTYARQTLGIELSQAKVEQQNFNVQKYIKVGKGKKKPTLDKELKGQLRKVQAKWRKEGVQAKITAKKVKRHVEESGRQAAQEYLGKMGRYGEGLAYLENVEWLAQYYEDLARGILIDDDLQNDVFEMAELIRARAEIFKEEWIKRLYQAAYSIKEAVVQGNAQLAKSYLQQAKSIII